ncbi:MAG: hypothetical protein AB1595_07015 [bacterium]
MDALRYDNLIESVKSLPMEEKEDLKFLIDKYLIEEQREEIYRNYQNSLKESKLEFSSDVAKLRKMIEE